MALGYLLCVLYFRSRGGYQQEPSSQAAGATAVPGGGLFV
jgi:hypothetical protein